MRFIGELKYGKYADNFENVHPDILQRYANANQDRHVRHDTIEVTANKFPFNSEAAELLFSSSLKEARESGIIPVGLGVAEEEWEGGIYTEAELVKVGRKEVEVALPFQIWWPRAVIWAQGLELMAKIQAVENGDILLV
ncbi:hypothetical protein C8R46DRAFT_1300877 [Mycena filopes]|nr:hypothetical protein C8R46DRAFT_1300877 [Mycena filopes]